VTFLQWVLKMTFLNGLDARGNPLNSLFFKCTFMVMLCVVAVVATITVMETRSKA
jgi:methyl-accepting chemotaxis protein